MNWKTWLPLVLAIVLGLAAMKVARDVMNKNDGAPAPAGQQVVVLKKDIAAGVQISAEDLATTTMSGELNAEAIFKDPSEAQGRVLAVAGIKGSPLLQTMLAPKGAGPGLQSLIPDGMRAITIEINEFSGVAGNLTAGSHVDLVTTINGEGEGMLTRTVVQNLKVQSLGMRRPPEGGDQPAGMRSVTLLATPREVEMIELAATTGRPRLVLRGVTDGETADTSGVTVAELRRASGLSDPFAAAEPTRTSTPVVTPAVQSSPTTQQSSAPAPVARTSSRFRDRQIKVIRGGIETTTTVQEVASPINRGWMTGAGSEELPGNENN